MIKTIKAKVKDNPTLAPRSELFVCMRCRGVVKGTIYDIDTNKLFCSIHPTEEVFTLSNIHYLEELQRLHCDGQWEIKSFFKEEHYNEDD